MASASPQAVSKFKLPENDQQNGSNNDNVHVSDETKQLVRKTWVCSLALHFVGVGGDYTVPLCSGHHYV